MRAYIALLRGVNVGGHRMLPMAELRARLLDLGYTSARTLLASGNVVFEAQGADPAALEAKLEADLDSAFGLKTDVLVRDPEEWDAIITANPYPEEARSDPSHLLVMALKTRPTAAAVKAVLDAHRGPELVHVRAREAYVYFGEGMGKSKLNLKPLGCGTARNWNTVLKLGTMVRG